MTTPLEHPPSASTPCSANILAATTSDLQTVFLNARFTTQPFSGVQRFSYEMTSALHALLGNKLQILSPRGSLALPGIRRVGRRDGHAWEQWDLPRSAQKGFLVNLGNTAPLLRRRQLVVLHDAGVFVTPEAYSWKFRTWYKLLQTFLARRQVRIVTVSESARADIAACLHLDPEDIPIIPEGSDHMDKIDADQETVHRLGLAPYRYALVVGNLAAHKNLGALTPLAQMLDARGLQLVVTGDLKGSAFAGDGLARLPHPALYAGRVNDCGLKALYQSALCLVVPSLYEGFGLPAIEAMRSGCAVVAADIAALRETCGGAALFCNPHEPDAFADRVKLILENDGLHIKLMAAGLAHTRSMSWSLAAGRLLEVIQTAQAAERNAACPAAA